MKEPIRDVCWSSIADVILCVVGNVFDDQSHGGVKKMVVKDGCQ